MTNKARFLQKKKKKRQPEFGPNGPKSCPKQGFCYFFKFASLVLLEIAYKDSLQQRQTSSRGKIHDKHFRGPYLGQRSQNQAQNYIFLPFPQV